MPLLHDGNHQCEKGPAQAPNALTNLPYLMGGSAKGAMQAPI
jgi:hypothetical protein